MSEIERPGRWRFRLQLLTGVAVLVLLVLVLQARSERARISRDRETLARALRQLVEVQQEHYARTGAYLTRLDSAVAWSPPPELTFVLEADDDQSWRATAHDTSLTIPPTTCGVFLGDLSASPHRAVIDPGIVACW